MKKYYSIAAAVAVLAVIIATGCATKFIDKVSQSRAAASKIGYRAVAEFNGWYSLRTNNPAAFKTTLDELNAEKGAVYTISTNLSLSLLTLEEVENAYRLAPTNQSAVVNAAAAVAANSSNIVKIVNLFTK